MQKSDIRRLIHRGVSMSCEISPAWDGSGCYVMRIRSTDSGAMELDRVLTHEDGAPLRFRDAARAHAMARQCGFAADTIEVRWPPRRSIATGTASSEICHLLKPHSNGLFGS